LPGNAGLIIKYRGRDAVRLSHRITTAAMIKPIIRTARAPRMNASISKEGNHVTHHGRLNTFPYAITSRMHWDTRYPPPEKE
jgi:hypothetical protein